MCACQKCRCVAHTAETCAPGTTRCAVEIWCDTRQAEATAGNGKHPNRILKKTIKIIGWLGAVAGMAWDSQSRGRKLDSRSVNNSEQIDM